MNPYSQLAVGAIGLSATISYAWWVRVRVWMLRQDLFTIRDELWMSMFNRGLLDDPDHREVRELINTVIRIAPLMSIFTFVRFYFISLPEYEESWREELTFVDPDVNTAVDRTAERILRYFFRETLSGVLARAFVYLICLLVFIPLDKIRRVPESLVRRVVRSPELRSFGRSIPAGKS